jgi:hypothetical protein
MILVETIENPEVVVGDASDVRLLVSTGSAVTHLDTASW